MSKRVLGLSALVLVGWGQVALADGKVFHTATAKVTIPDQQALIAYADGTETLVIETRFVGEGEEFAWVVPVPAVPEVSEVTTGLFPTLQVLTLPEVEHSVPSLYVLVMVVSIALALGFCRRLISAIVLILVFFMGMSVFVPSLGTAGTSARPVASTQDGVTVYDRQIVGEYEVTTVSSDEPNALVSWLTGNGFSVDGQSAGVIDEYVEQDWVFAAVKLQRDEDTTDPTTPHPLAFTFATDKPVYPLKLTGVGDEACAIDLYVFGAERAEVPGFTVKRCDKAAYPTLAPTGRGRRSSSEGINIVHPQLRELVDRLSVVTKLSAALTSEQMVEDAYVSWCPYEPYEETFYTGRGATVYAANIVSSVLAIGLLSVLILTNAKKVTRATGSRAAVGVLVIGVLAGGITYWRLPRTEARVTRWSPVLVNMRAHREIGRAILEGAAELEEGTQVDEAWLRDRVARCIQAEHGSQDRGTNSFTGLPRREEDSPGNYGFRVGERQIEYLWYDHGGRERRYGVSFGDEGAESFWDDTDGKEVRDPLEEWRR